MHRKYGVTRYVAKGYVIRLYCEFIGIAWTEYDTIKKRMWQCVYIISFHLKNVEDHLAAGGINESGVWYIWQI